MVRHYAQNWGLLALRGVISLLFGLVAFIHPFTTLSVLVMFFGAFVLIDGVFALAAAFRASANNPRRWTLLFEGILGIIAGLYAFLFPPGAVLTLIIVAAVWAIFTGILQITTAIALRKEIANEWMLILGGVASVLLGILLFAAPGAGALVWAYMIAAYALVSGITLIGLSLRLRGHSQATPPQSTPLSAGS